jgi:hypothetical protein
MGVWRYCDKCGAGQDQITLEELEAISYSETAKVECTHCHADRGDDTPELRFNLLLIEVIGLRKEVEALK